MNTKEGIEMNASVQGINRVAAYFGDLNSQSLRHEIETLRDLVKVLTPIAEIFSGLIGSTMGAARSSASSMLFPLIAMGGLLASDVVNNPASSYNKGGTLVEKAKALDQERAHLSADARALVELDGQKVSSGKKVPPKSKQFTVEDGLGATTLEKNKRTAARVNKQIERVRTKVKENAEEVIRMTTEISKEGQAKLVGLKEAKNNSQVTYDALSKSLGTAHADTIAAQIQLQTATKREQIITAIITKNSNMTSFEKVDNDVDQIIRHENAAKASKNLADSRYFFNGSKIKADNTRANQHIATVDNMLKQYGLSRSLLAE